MNPSSPKKPESAIGRNVSDLLRELVERILVRSENFVAGRYWMLEVVFLAVLFTILFSGGVDDRLWEVNNNHYYPAYFKKIEHPLFDVGKAYGPFSHEAKLNFRLTVPVLLHLLHVPADQRWVLPVLTGAAVCGLILLACVFTFRATGDRVCSLYATLAVACTYIGSFAFTLYYDTIALCQLVLAMLPSVHWSLRALLVFTASFTDERAFLAAPLLLVQTLCSPAAGTTIRQRILNLSFLAVIAGMAAYCLVRFVLIQFAGLSSPFQGVGWGVLLDNVNYWHFGTWLALKGGWLLVGLAWLSLWQRRQFFTLAAFALTTLVVISGGFLVEDVIRSTSYVLPAFFVAIMVVNTNDSPRSMRIYCLTAFVISAVIGNYNIWRDKISWFQPLAAKFVYYVLHGITHFFARGT